MLFSMKYERHIWGGGNAGAPYRDLGHFGEPPPNGKSASNVSLAYRARICLRSILSLCSQAIIRTGVRGFRAGFLGECDSGAPTRAPPVTGRSEKARP